jgi:hypothetical protein
MPFEDQNGGEMGVLHVISCLLAQPHLLPFSQPFGVPQSLSENIRQYFIGINIMSIGFGVGDIIQVTELAISINRDCYAVARGAPQEFQLLMSEVSALSNALKILQDELNNADSILVQAGKHRVKMAREIVSRVEVTLKELQKVIKKYEIIGDASKRKRICERLKWSLEFKSIHSLRSRVF